MIFWRKKGPAMTPEQSAFDKVRRSPEYAEQLRRTREMMEPLLAAERAKTDRIMEEIKRRREQRIRDAEERSIRHDFPYSAAVTQRILQDRNNIW